MSEFTALDTLTELVIEKFNIHYGYKFTREEFSIKKIMSNIYSKVAYELETIRTDDKFFIRIYCNIATNTVIGNFTMLDRGINGLDTDTTVFVSDVLIGKDLLDLDNSFIRREIDTTDNLNPLFTYLATEDGRILTTEDGKAILY